MHYQRLSEASIRNKSTCWIKGMTTITYFSLVNHRLAQRLVLCLLFIGFVSSIEPALAKDSLSAKKVATAEDTQQKVSSEKVAETFEQCKIRLTTKAKEVGVDSAVVDAQIPNLKKVEKVLEYDRNQPEFVTTFPNYYSKRVNDWRINKGKEAMLKHGDFLTELTEQYGIPGHYLLSFWGLETNFGNYKGKMSTLNSLATLACDPRRQSYFTQELMQALKLMDREGLKKDQMIGSWAGAMGHTQFMPSAYMRYAIDGDDDGRINLWDSEKDALASAANFLSQLGWKPGLRWGREVLLPENFDYSIVSSSKREVAYWSSLGVLKADGTELGKSDIPSKLLIPAGHEGPAFLVYHNFNTILRWNNSEFYGIAVGQLANRIIDKDKLSKPLPDLPNYSIQQMANMQRQLTSIGFDVGGIDGIIGPATRGAIAKFQASQNMIADGFPSTKTLEAIKTVVSAGE
jgi:membrane-bound lytic murein transglycosylase B